MRKAIVVMLLTSFFSMVVITGCTNAKKEQSVKTNEYDKNADSLQVVAIVKDFFKAFDERDLQKMNEILGPGIKIIHHNGATTNRDEMLTVIKETKNWWPRTRKLSDFEFIGSTDIAAVGVMNEVIFSLPKNKKIVELYKESWIFKKIETQWKPVRCHYSKVIVDKHSEEVE